MKKLITAISALIFAFLIASPCIYAAETNETVSFSSEMSVNAMAASEIEINTEYSADLADEKDADYYAFNVPSAGHISVSVEGTGAFNLFISNISDCSSNFLCEGFMLDEAVRSAKTTEVGVSAGKYYICIKGGGEPQTAAVPYTFKVNYQEAANWEKEGTDNIVVLNTEYYGSLTYPGTSPEFRPYYDSDTFKFIVPERGDVTVTLTVTNHGNDGTDECCILTNNGDIDISFNAETISYTSAPVTLMPGESSVTVRQNEQGNSTFEYSIKINFMPNPIEAESIGLNKTSLTLDIGENETLIADIEPGNASDKTITWISSDESVAAVDANGNVKAIKAGIAAITAKTANDKTVTCTVTVKAIETGVEAYVERLYTVALGRASDPAGKADWVHRLESGEATGAEVAAGFILSDEFKRKALSDNDFIDVMYKTFFDRRADSSGKAYWIDALSKGVSHEYVLRGFAESNEFQALCNKFSITRGSITLTQPRDQNIQLTSFVNRLYTELLKRGGEEGGLNDWCGRILRRQETPKQAAHGFVFSAEFMTSVTDNETFVDRMYRTFLGRDADAPGKADWLNRLANGQTKEQIFNGFADSVEFEKIVASFGL